MNKTQSALPDNKYCWTLLDNPSTDVVVKAVYRHKHASVWLAIRPIVSGKYHAELFSENTPVDERIITDANALLALIRKQRDLAETIPLSICPTANSTRKAYESAELSSSTR